MKFKYITVISSLTVIILIKLTTCIAEVHHHTILDNLTWECANNASCVDKIANNVLNRYQRKETIDFGLFSVKPLSTITNHKTINEARSSSIMNFLYGNMVRIPIGPMVFSIQRSDDNDYLEFALLKKVHEENGRRHGGIGGGGGFGGMKEKKHMQIYIPMYLAATTFGWTLAAIKAVGVITIKALFVSKLALILAGVLIVKKLMESAAEKMYLPHYPEHHHEHPFMLPYNIDYAHLPHPITGADMSPQDLYSLHFAHPHDIPQTGIENLGAESSLSHSVQAQNTTQSQIAPSLNSATYPKVKREDHQTWNGLKMKPLNYIGPNNPLYVYRKL